MTFHSELEAIGIERVVGLIGCLGLLSSLPYKIIGLIGFARWVEAILGEETSFCRSELSFELFERDNGESRKEADIHTKRVIGRKESAADAENERRRMLYICIQKHAPKGN